VELLVKSVADPHFKVSNFKLFLKLSITTCLVGESVAEVVNCGTVVAVFVEFMICGAVVAVLMMVGSLGAEISAVLELEAVC
jgi:hypothetical protein